MTISNILGCAGSVIFILFISIVIPIFGPFFSSLLAPLPFLFYFSKLGPEKGFKVNLIAILVVGIVAELLGLRNLIFLCIEFGIAGYIISELFRRELPFSVTIFMGTLLMLLVLLIIIFFTIVITGTTPIEAAINYMQALFETAISTYEKDGSHTEMVDRLIKVRPTFIEEAKKIYNKFYPSFMVIGTGIAVWFNVVVSKPLFRIKGIKYPDLGRADMFRAPEFLVWVLIAAGFAKLLSISILDFAAINALIIISVIYVFHGLSIVMFFFKKYNVPALTRYVIYLIIILQPLSMVILALMGLFDQWFDFRKINSKARPAE